MGRTKGSGQGSVYKRGNKSRGQININGERLSFTADKRKDVIDWLAKVRTEALFGYTPKNQDYTVEEWMEIYFEKWYKAKVTTNTYNNTYNLIKNHLYPVLGNMLLTDLSANMIQDAYSKMWCEKEGKKYGSCKYSDGTIKIFSSAFRQALVCAQNEGLIGKNPFYGVVVPKTGVVKQVDSYSEEDYRKIVEFTKDKTNIDRVFYLLVATGMRVGELIALTWDDVDLKEGSINITKTAVNQGGHMIIQDHPKTEQSVRKIYISRNTVQVLHNLKGVSKCARGLVLPNDHGNIYHTSALRSRWVKVCAELGIPYKNLHALRHSYVTMALEKQIPVHTVSKMIGHKSIATTMDIYKSVFAEQKKEAAKMMNDLV